MRLITLKYSIYKVCRISLGVRLPYRVGSPCCLGTSNNVLQVCRQEASALPGLRLSSLGKCTGHTTIVP